MSSLVQVDNIFLLYDGASGAKDGVIDFEGGNKGLTILIQVGRLLQSLCRGWGGAQGGGEGGSVRESCVRNAA